MENAEQTPEQAQWTAIHSNLDALGQLLGLTEDETLALQVHIAPQEPLSAPLDLEPAAWQLRAAFDEWRARSDVVLSTGQAVRTTQETRWATARSIMARLLGRRHPYQEPQSFGALIDDRKPFEIPQMVEAVETVTEAMLAFTIAQIEDKKIALAAQDMTPATAKLSRPVHETRPYALETGPELLAGILGHVDAYVSVVGSHPLLSAEEEAALFQRMQARNNDDKLTPDAALARTQLIVHNLRLVLWQAFHTLAHKPDADNMLGDLIQTGNLSLIRTIDKFNPERGTRLSTFAVVGIRNSMIRWITQHGDETGTNYYRMTRNKEVQDAFEQTRKVEPEVTMVEVASRLGYGFLQLAAIPEDRRNEIPDPGMDADELERQALIRRVWQKVEQMPDLTSRQHDVLRLLYVDGLTLQQAGEQLEGVSHQAISQMHHKALAKVRRHFGLSAPGPKRKPFPLSTIESLLEAAAIQPAAGENLETAVRRALATGGLSDNEIAAITLRYGLDGEPPLTFAEIQKRLGMNDGVARHYLMQGVKKLRRVPGAAPNNADAG